MPTQDYLTPGPVTHTVDSHISGDITGTAIGNGSYGYGGLSYAGASSGCIVAKFSNIPGGSIASGVLQDESSDGQSYFGILAASLGSTLDDITTNLTHCWKYNEGSGTSAADSSGNANTLTLVNGVAWSGILEGPLGYPGIVLDGSNDYCTFSDINVSDGTPVSFATWIATSDTDGYIVGNYNSANNPGIVITGNGTIKVGRVNGLSANFSVPGLSNGAAHHLVVIWLADGTASVYFDGAFVANQAASNNGVWINALGRRLGGTFLGANLWGTRIYVNRVLTAGAVTALYQYSPFDMFITAAGASNPSNPGAAPNAFGNKLSSIIAQHNGVSGFGGDGSSANGGSSSACPTADGIQATDGMGAPASGPDSGAGGNGSLSGTGSNGIQPGGGGGNGLDNGGRGAPGLLRISYPTQSFSPVLALQNNQLVY